MVFWARRRRFSPIGVDIGSRSVKLVQLSPDYSEMIDAARWDFASDFDELSPEQKLQRVTDALRRVREGRRFRGRDAVLCLNRERLFLQNLRIPKRSGEDLREAVCQESSGRLPFPVEEADLHFLDAGEIRQSDAAMREVIVTACHRPALQALLGMIEAAGLRPISVAIEPTAIVRSYSLQFRRDEDQDRRVMFVHVGYANSVVVIAQDERILFVKYIDSAGRQMDQAMMTRLKMDPREASSLRRHNGDRRRELQDPDVSRSVGNAIRPVIERLTNEISLCSRYHSVTFRGQPICRLVLSGGEASQQLAETLQNRLNIPCLLSESLRRFETDRQHHPLSQWDIAIGLAAHDLGVSK